MAELSNDLKIRFVYESPSLHISEYHCCKQTPHRGGEEQQPGHVISFARSGVYVKHLNGRDIVVDANNAIFFNRSETYYTSHPYGCGDSGAALVIAPELLESMIDRYDPGVRDRPGTPFPTSHCPLDSRTYLLQRLVTRQLPRAGVDDPVLLEETILSLVDQLMAQAFARAGTMTTRRRAATQRAHEDAACNVRGLLAAQFRNRWRLDEIARTVHCSPYHLCRVFKRLTGQSIHQYLNRLRLRAALECLAEPDTNLARLALELGYSSHSHFSDSFRREFRTTPSRVRRSATSGGLREMSRILEA